MKQKHSIVRDVHKQRVRRREEMAVKADFSGVQVADKASKMVMKAVHHDIIDIMDLDIIEWALATKILGFLESTHTMQVTASKTGYELLRDVSYESKLKRELLVGAQALAVEALIERVHVAAMEAIRHLSALRHEDFPESVDDSHLAEANAMWERAEAARMSDVLPPASKPWLFGKSTNVLPAERKRLAEAQLTRQHEAVEVHVPISVDAAQTD